MTGAVGAVGSSARAAVHSLARAHFLAWGVDQFGDRDLKRVAACAVCPADRYPEAIPELATQFPPGPVIYTGGLENHPHIVAELAKSREVWGNAHDVLARVRDPFQLFPPLRAAGFATPRLVPRGQPCPTEGRWLRKPYSSGGGIGIRFARPGEPPSPQNDFQEFVAGTPMSAVFVNADLFGVTEQLIGRPWLHASGFTYCGNVGPCAVPPGVERLGRFLSTRTGLCGVWGCDFMLHEGVPVVLEVNPRYTAAVEVLEHASERPTPPAPLPEGKGEEDAPAFTLAVFPDATPRVLPPPFREGSRGGRADAHVGKAIYYAPHGIHFPPVGPWDADLAGDFDPWRLPAFADIPEPGGTIQTGWPVLTFFATGRTPAEATRRLQSQAAELDRLFAEHAP